MVVNCDLIPSALAGAAGEACRIKARSFSYAHQIYSLMLGQLCGAFSLNEICDAEELYRARWQVELLFKELKQTLRLRDFYGENRNAVEWQVWTALLVHLLLRYLAFQSRWRGSHTRFAGVVKAAAWERTDLLALLSAYGTAPPRDGMSDGAKTPCLPGFERFFLRSMGQHTA